MNQLLKQVPLRRPVAIEGLLSRWDAARLWTKDFFCTYYGDLKVTVRNSENYDSVRTVPLSEYISDLEKGGPCTNYYLKDWRFEFDCPSLKQDYCVPEYLYSWTERLPALIRPIWRWIFIGPPNTASHLHVDFLNTSAWNALLSGKKRWIFFQPGEARWMYRGKVNAFSPDFEQFPLFRRAKPIVYIQNAGEVLVTPGGWWHAVRNEEVSIALSENFINRTNFSNYFSPRALYNFFRFADHPLWLK
ncbi:MAG: cupin-like domain-containing protein [Acidobacteriia bacterium]|nr:cupin-like domain-containing protein [Terriglobia bacterium]